MMCPPWPLLCTGATSVIWCVLPVLERGVLMERISARRATKYPANTPPAATNVLHPSTQCPAGIFIIILKVTVRYFWRSPKFMIYDCPFYSLIGRYRLAIDQLLSKFGTFSHKYRTVFHTTILSSWIFD